MPILTAEARHKLKDSDFALPGRRFPIHNIDHARVALSMAHNASPAEQKVIKSKVHEKYPSIGQDDENNDSLPGQGSTKNSDKMTVAQDHKFDKKHGIKEGSKADKIEDAKHGVKDSSDDVQKNIQKIWK